MTAHSQSQVIEDIHWDAWHSESVFGSMMVSTHPQYSGEETHERREEMEMGPRQLKSAAQWVKL